VIKRSDKEVRKRYNNKIVETQFTLFEERKKYLVKNKGGK